jgi:hypothetical protein
MKAIRTCWLAVNTTAARTSEPTEAFIDAMAMTGNSR